MKSMLWVILYIYLNMSSFQFNFEVVPNSNQQNNLQVLMKKMDQDDSFQFDKFDPVDNEPHQTSGNSDFFQPTDKKKSSQKRESAKSRDHSRQLQFQNSRNINQISIIDNVKNQSFRYQQPPNNMNVIDTNNERYQNLQKLFNKAKTNNLDHFYRNLDQQNTYVNQQKFRNKDQFRRYKNELKIYKKSLEEDFQNTNGNYNFKYNQYPANVQGRRSNEVDDFFASSNDGFNFKKKQVKATNDDFNFFGEQQNSKKGNMLNVGLQPDDDLDNRQLKPQEINIQLQKYRQLQQKQQAGQFFRDQKPKKKSQKEKEVKKLQTINQGREDMFEVTQQEQKMKKLLNNYQQLKVNYSHLMSNLKETNTDQEKIINQLKKLKVQYENKESRFKIQEESKKEKQIQKEREKEQKFKKIIEIKDEIHKIKENTDKDLMINKLNQKVQNLQNILRNAIQELHQEKEPKLIPKIINYYNEPQYRLESERSRASHEVNLSGDEASKGSSMVGKLEENYYLGAVRKAVKQLKEPINFVDQFSSPLQLDLTVQDPLNVSRGYSQQLQQPFVPADNSKEYLPNSLDSNNKLLRRCLTQKSSILFESFQFYVTGKYTITGNDRFPVTCEVRVANKCAINLYDIFVIVYGPQAQSAELEMRPSKIMYDEFKYNTSFLFQVDLSKSCIEMGNFSIQLSYKTDSVNKKKVNFKAVLPFAQLIKPEFIYQEQFTNAWNHMDNQYYIKPRLLDFKSIRSHEDLKLILPFMEINQADPNSFSYGIMFSYPKSSTMFMLKVTCYVSGKASIHLRSSQANQNVEKKLRQQILDIICYLVYG